MKFENIILICMCVCCLELCLGYNEGAFFGMLSAIVVCLLVIIEYLKVK